mgnify:CR=1 FL=1
MHWEVVWWCITWFSQTIVYVSISDVIMYHLIPTTSNKCRLATSGICFSTRSMETWKWPLFFRFLSSVPISKCEIKLCEGAWNFLEHFMCGNIWADSTKSFLLYNQLNKPKLLCPIVMWTHPLNLFYFSLCLVILQGTKNDCSLFVKFHVLFRMSTYEENSGRIWALIDPSFQDGWDQWS